MKWGTRDLLGIKLIIFGTHLRAPKLLSASPNLDCFRKMLQSPLYYINQKKIYNYASENVDWLIAERCGRSQAPGSSRNYTNQKKTGITGYPIRYVARYLVSDGIFRQIFSIRSDIEYSFVDYPNGRISRIWPCTKPDTRYIQLLTTQNCCSSQFVSNLKLRLQYC